MSEEGRETPRTGHIYDEIEELDHPVPRWFQGLFYSTVVFGLVYLFYYTLGGGPSLLQEYQQDRTADEIATHEMLIKGGGPKLYTEAELLAFFKEPDRKERGDASFKSKCASCHGNQGQGGIGPNLTDSYWLHGGKHTEILTSILKAYRTRECLRGRRS